MRRFIASLASVVTLFSCCSCNKQVDARIHIRIWHQKISAERDLFNEHLSRFNRDHPNVVVEALYKENEELRNLYVVAAVAGQGPDIIYGPSDNVGMLVTTGSLARLDDILPADYLTSFIDGGVIRWKDGAWLVADQLGNHLALVCNRALVPNPPSTLRELIALAQQLTIDRDGDGKPDQYGLTWNYREPFFFIPFLSAFGGAVMDDAGNPTLDNEQTVQAIQFVLDLRDKYHVIPKEGDYEIADMLFKQSRTAMIINGPWSWTAYQVPDKSYVAVLPKNEVTGLPSAPMISAKGYSVNVNVTPAKRLAIAELLAYLTGALVQTEMAARLSTTPTLRRVVESPETLSNPTLVASMQQIREGKAIPIVPRMRAIWDGMRGPYQLVMNGSISAREAAHQMQREAEKNIKDSSL